MDEAVSLRRSISWDCDPSSLRMTIVQADDDCFNWWWRA